MKLARKVVWGAIPLVLVLSERAAFAMPEVGDDAQYSVQTQTNGQSSTGTDELKILSYNSSTHQYQEQDASTTGSAATQIQQPSIPEAQFLSNSFVNQQITHCSEIGGTIQSVTVPAGDFQACAVPMNNGVSHGTVWFGHVPFGIIKIETFGPNKNVLRELINYSFGGN